MNVTLYTNNSESNELNKVLSNSLTFECILREATSVQDPIILLEVNANISQYNYCYIEDFQRYYYIRDIVSIRNKLWQVHCHVDVLMSFKTSILSSTAILDETTVTGASNYISNNVWTALAKDKTSIIPFSSGLLNNGTYILITAGG